MKDRKTKRPIALDAYEAMAESYAARVDTKVENAYYERPAMLSLLPDVSGKRVLDAGCGPGVYSEILCDRGATVTACDVSPKMVAFARQSLGGRAEVFQANLESRLEFAQDESYDLVLCSLVLDHIKDWNFTFGEFQRVLKANGYFVFSVLHPFPEFQKHSRDGYFAIELLEGSLSFGKPVKVLSYRRPLSSMFSSLTESGFLIEKLIEPIPTEEFKKKDREMFKELCRRPGFLCIRAIKRSKHKKDEGT